MKKLFILSLLLYYFDTRNELGFTCDLNNVFNREYIWQGTESNLRILFHCWIGYGQESLLGFYGQYTHWRKNLFIVKSTRLLGYRRYQNFCVLFGKHFFCLEKENARARTLMRPYLSLRRIQIMFLILYHLRIFLSVC